MDQNKCNLFVSNVNQKNRDNKSALNTSNLANDGGGNKKWSLKRLFRKKRESVCYSSSDEDKKAGFIPMAKNVYNNSSTNKLNTKCSKNNSGVKSINTDFDQIAMNQSSLNIIQKHPQSQIDDEYFLSVETVEPGYVYCPSKPDKFITPSQLQMYSRSSNSLDRHAGPIAPESRSIQRLQHSYGGRQSKQSSSEEELISLNSTTFAKYLSDESINCGAQIVQNGNQSRRSRASRNERYLKRRSRDEFSNFKVPSIYGSQPVQRWKTQPVPVEHVRNYTPHLIPSTQQLHHDQMRNNKTWKHITDTSLSSKIIQNSIKDNKRSASYDSHIQLQTNRSQKFDKSVPPTPPPRDPLRRVHITDHLNNASISDLRPFSCVIDQSNKSLLSSNIGNKSRISGRCVSDDKIWVGNIPQSQSQNMKEHKISGAHHINSNFIPSCERNERSCKLSHKDGYDYQYITDSTPRSRKPICMLNQHIKHKNENSGVVPKTSVILRTTKSGLPTSPPKSIASDFWKQVDQNNERNSRLSSRLSEAIPVKPRSISSSRINDLSYLGRPIYCESNEFERKGQHNPITTFDDKVGVVRGSLHIKPSQLNSQNDMVIPRKCVNNKQDKSCSIPVYYQRRSTELLPTPNKYEEYVTEKREQHNKKQLSNPSRPLCRKLSVPTVSALELNYNHKKPANLEEAIEELEIIYKSLGLSEKNEQTQTPSISCEFDKLALAHADDYDDDDSFEGEPDVVHDDVVVRNMQLVNLQYKTIEKQPPFGIPIGPVVPAPQSDYLHITPIVSNEIYVSNGPDLIKDDLAVRTLRKEMPGVKETFHYPYSGMLQKKNRATRTQSANIYSLIQRDAAKPSGGDILSYLELSKTLDRTNSLTDLHRDITNNNPPDDVPETLSLLRILSGQEVQLNQSIQSQKESVPHVLFQHPTQGGAISNLSENLASKKCCEEIIQDLPESLLYKNDVVESVTVSPLQINQIEDALNQIAKDAQESSIKLSKELKDLQQEVLTTRSKINADELKLEQELEEIESVSKAAKRCGKILLETLPDTNNDEGLVKQRNLQKEEKLIEAIDQVSEAANAVCAKIFKDIEPPIILSDGTLVDNKADLLCHERNIPTLNTAKLCEPLTMPRLIKNLDFSHSNNIEAIAERCMRQISVLGKEDDYDNVQCMNQDLTVPCNTSKNKMIVNSILCTLAESKPLTYVPQTQQILTVELEEIDKIMMECEQKATVIPQKSKELTSKPTSELMLNDSKNATTSDISTSNNATNSSSSDCLAKSSSPTASWQKSSSITSFNPLSSSDYIISPSSECLAISTDAIKTLSTTSYEVQSTSTTPNITTHSTFSYSPSPPPNLTPVSQSIIGVTCENVQPSAISQYNSTEELAMIFGKDEKTKQQLKLLQGTQIQEQQSSNATNISGKAGEISATNLLFEMVSVIAIGTAKKRSNNHAVLVITPVMPTNSQRYAAACHNYYSEHDRNYTETNITNAAASNVLDVTDYTHHNACIKCILGSPYTNATYDNLKLETIYEILREQMITIYINNCRTVLNVSLNCNCITANEVNVLGIKLTLPDLAVQKMFVFSRSFLKSLSVVGYAFSSVGSNNLSTIDFLIPTATKTKLEISNDCYSYSTIRQQNNTELFLKVANNVKHKLPYSNQQLKIETNIKNNYYMDKMSASNQISSIISIVAPHLNIEISDIMYLNSDKIQLNPIVVERIWNTKLQEYPRQRSVIVQQNKRIHNNNSGILYKIKGNEKPNTSVISTYSVFDELQPQVYATTHSLTSLEHFMIACLLGVITPKNLFILFFVVIGVITIIAIVL